MHLDFVSRPEIRQFIIVGTEATVIADLLNRQAWIRDTKGNIVDHIDDGGLYDADYVEEMRSFINRIQGQEALGD